MMKLRYLLAVLVSKIRRKRSAKKNKEKRYIY